MHQQQSEITAKSDKQKCLTCFLFFLCVRMFVKLQDVLQCDTYTRRLVLGEHTPGVIVEVVFICWMLGLSKAVDKL